MKHRMQWSEAQLIEQIIDGRKTARSHGRPDMPVWGEVFVKAESAGGGAASGKVEAIAHFLWSIQEGGD